MRSMPEVMSNMLITIGLYDMSKLRLQILQIMCFQLQKYSWSSNNYR